MHSYTATGYSTRGTTIGLCRGLLGFLLWTVAGQLRPSLSTPASAAAATGGSRVTKASAGGAFGKAANIDPTGPFTRDDLLVCMATHGAHNVLVPLSRGWRQGVRMHVTTDPTSDLHRLSAWGAFFNESFSVTPDFPGHPKTLRHTLSPVFAHQAHRGSAERPGYRWMLVGDDDTVWNVPAVLRMLNNVGLSYKDPIALSDFLTTCDFVKGKAKPRRVSVSRDHTCLPCPGGQALCPCRLGEHKVTRTECVTGGGVSFYGGTGVVLSYGMLESLMEDPSHIYSVAMSGFSPYSDKLIAEAIRRLGYGFTAPHPAPHPSQQGAPLTQTRRALAFINRLDPGRLFGTLDQANDRRDIADRERDLLARPGVFKTMVSAHLRRHKMTLKSYAKSYQRIAEAMCANAGDV